MYKKALLIFLFLSPQVVLSDHRSNASTWQVVPVANQSSIVKLPNGEQITIDPSCAFDSVPDPADPTGQAQIPNQFHFFYKQGDSDKLLIFFNGGGACWNDATCIKSLVIGERSAYNPTVHQANAPMGAGGVFDDSNDRNPFKDWSKVFIPYCTGDIHIGSKTVIYPDTDGVLTGSPGALVPVKHHGFDNAMAVVDWVKKRFSRRESSLKKLVVSGSSAGGYGATLNFPIIQDTFPGTNAVLMSDASMAVVTQGFLDTVFVAGGNWNLENTLYKRVFGEAALGSYDAYTFNDVLLDRLTKAYPKDRFAQDTKAFDVVQVSFLKIMRMTDAGSNDPLEWGLNPADPSDAALFGEWNFRMETSLNNLSASTRNYQHYIGPGYIHTLMTDAFATPEEPHPFYGDSAQGVYFSEWVNRLVNSRYFSEQSLNYVN